MNKENIIKKLVDLKERELLKLTDSHFNISDIKQFSNNVAMINQALSDVSRLSGRNGELFK